MAEASKYPPYLQPGTTQHYSALQLSTANRASALGLGDQAVIFAALESKWADLPGVANLPDADFKTAVTALLAESSDAPPQP